jgi:hypothetical protein
MDTSSNVVGEAQPEEACAAELGPQLRKVAMAARALWPDGRVPAIFGVRERNRRLREWCLANGLRSDELPSDSTIYRFFLDHLQGLAHT